MFVFARQLHVWLVKDVVLCPYLTEWAGVKPPMKLEGEMLYHHGYVLLNASN